MPSLVHTMAQSSKHGPCQAFRAKLNRTMLRFCYLCSSLGCVSREERVSNKSKANLLTVVIVAALLLAVAHYYGFVQWGGSGWG